MSPQARGAGRILLALAVHPWYAAVSGFFGAGLLMAGITDLCPLALLVAVMPWNRSAAPADSSRCISASASAGSSCSGGK